MGLWMLAAPVPRIMEQCRRGIRTAEGSIVPHIDPQTRRIGLATRHDRHRGVVAMQARGIMNMGFDQPVERHQRMTCRPDLIGECGDAEWHALAGKAFGLAVERLVLTILLEQKHREEARPRPPARNDMERCRRLRDRLAGPAGESLPHRLDHLPLPRDHLQRLGDVLAQLRQPGAATGRAGTRALDHHTLARQVFGKGLSGRALALETTNARRLCRGGFGSQTIFTGIGLKILELQLQLIEQTTAALGAGAKLLAPQTGNLQLQMRDQRLGRTLPGTRIGQSGLGLVGPANGRPSLLRASQNQRFQRLDVVRKSGSGGFHTPERTYGPPRPQGVIFIWL